MAALDIAGNFAAGQESTLRRRQARQLERAADYELDEIEQARQRRHQRRKAAGLFYGYEVPGYEEVQTTNDDPLWTKLMNWWKDRRATRVEPSTQLSEIDLGGLPQRRSAIPTMADGGAIEEELARRNVANRARYETARTERALSPSQIAERRGTNRPGVVRRAINSRAGRGGVATAGIAGAITGGRTPTEQYRERFGLEPSEREGIPRMLEDVAVRALGVSSDVGNALTLGQAGRFYRDLQPEEATPPSPGAALPVAAQPSGSASTATPDEALADQAIQDGTAMAEEAAAQNAPPGDIDFSQVDWRPDEIPNMTVGDWVEYRNVMVDTMLAEGASMQEAMQTVTRMQQQNAVDYMSQAEYHLGMGNPQAAASSLRMAFQYFPNGSDVQLGVYQDPETGQPALLGRGYNEETGEPMGNPMYLSSERLAALRANFADPSNFLAWTKDWRDEAFREREFSLERQKAESQAQYQDRLGRAALRRADADVIAAQGRAAGGGRTQADLDRALAAFERTTELLGLTDEQTANRLTAAMGEIYSQNPGIPYTTVIDFVERAHAEGSLEQMLTDMGL